MKLSKFIIIGLAVGLAGCAEKEQVVPPSDEAAKAAAEAPAPAKEQMGTAAFIEHMHHHASQLGQLNAALEIGSLAAAQRPAYWLAGHDEIGGVPEDWQVYINGMRDAANAVDSARDISEARAAAERIEANCQGCHSSAGIDVPNLMVE
jgi:hypothetical protein